MLSKDASHSRIAVQARWLSEGTRIIMLNYAREQAVEALRSARSAILATSGPAGVQVSEVSCQAIDLDLYLLVPQTSDQLFNLEHDPAVTLLASGWELSGEAEILSGHTPDAGLELLREPGAPWCALVRVYARRLQMRREGGWGGRETIDLRQVTPRREPGPPIPPD